MTPGMATMTDATASEHAQGSERTRVRVDADEIDDFGGTPRAWKAFSHESSSLSEGSSSSHDQKMMPRKTDNSPNKILS